MGYETEQAQFQACRANLPEVMGTTYERRSANYMPNIWNYDFLQSLNSRHDLPYLPHTSEQTLACDHASICTRDAYLCLK
ncbi:hypothetical protein BT93_D0572 [Corymbia citriodora subsp. variegata]|nr:hypothetical protein BT93_D0572 [Corymbia citriodora subsp. variegata]